MSLLVVCMVLHLRGCGAAASLSLGACAQGLPSCRVAYLSTQVLGCTDGQPGLASYPNPLLFQLHQFT